MFNHNDYRMAKAQQERLLAQAETPGGRAQRPNPFVALLRRLAGRSERKVDVQLDRKPAKV